MITKHQIISVTIFVITFSSINRLTFAEQHRLLDDEVVRGLDIVKPFSFRYSRSKKPSLDTMSGVSIGSAKKRSLDPMSGMTFGSPDKRNFDEIDNVGFNGFVKRNFDEIDRSGFNGFAKRNFDEIDRTSFGGFVKRNFDEIDRSGFNGFSKKNFDEIDRAGFGGFVKKANGMNGIMPRKLSDLPIKTVELSLSAKEPDYSNYYKSQ